MNFEKTWKYKSRGTNRYPKGKKYRVKSFKPTSSRTQADIQTHRQLVELILHCFSGKPWKLDPEQFRPVVEEHLEKTYRHPHGLCLVVRHKGRMVGFALGLPLGAMPTNVPMTGPTSVELGRQASKFYLLSHVGMDSSHRHVGVPKLLSEIRQAYAREMGYEQALIALHPDANKRFVKMYEKDGFQHVYKQLFRLRKDEPIHPNLFQKTLQKKGSTQWKGPKDNWYSQPPPSTGW